MNILYISQTKTAAVKSVNVQLIHTHKQKPQTPNPSPNILNQY